MCLPSEAVQTLDLFFDSLRDRDRLRELPEDLRGPSHVIALLREMLDILCSGDRAVGEWLHLRQLADQYHVESLRLFGEESGIPKSHYVHHIPDMLRKTNLNLSCFGPERRHGTVKALARHALHTLQKESGMESILGRLWDDYTSLMVVDTTFRPVYATSSLTPRPELRRSALSVAPDFGYDVSECSSIHTIVGQVKVDDFACLLRHGRVLTGFVDKLLIGPTLPSNEVVAAVSVRVWARARPGIWRRTPASVWCRDSDVKHVCPYVSEIDGVRPLVPRGFC